MEGGATGGVDELYREVILDHFKKPKNRGKLDKANAKADGMNPLCGDQLSISATVDGDVVKDIKFEGHGCAISQSAASMLSEAVKGKALSQVSELIALYKKMFGVKDEDISVDSNRPMDDLGDLISLEGVKKYPVRIKCALLSANTVLESLRPFLKREDSHGR
jgi:nitrogen fixation protein NifU and related proteins